MKTKKMIAALKKMQAFVKNEQVSLTGLDIQNEAKILGCAQKALKENKKLRKENNKLKERIASLELEQRITNEYPDGYTM